ncbi:histidine kinase dimerization/phospho-acceptor domain-containing protein [Paraglaciecola psychrophila]|uniref:histidine kinase n=1 Tax=Paraglaciecola psychrophila 170 TaxID=1129794 RepID=M4RMM1_9ALTE|nr:histidine kinase dimerization/phospho-acceptor domain-containing protein [Paraglaciecola psychrophila]AGH43404.1 histidine kinase [Paraglaciecola psychrophila 170]
MEFTVEQRTRELTNANLKLTKIDSRRRQFIADVSHELRTPLTIIRGEAQVTLRLKSACEEDYQATLTAILEQSVNLSRLVDDLLL